MAAPDYSDIAKAAARVQERTGVSDTVLINDMLETTAGVKTDGTVVYRPFWAAATLIDMDPNRLLSAEGAQFRDPDKIINSYRELQWSLDAQLELTVPEGQGRGSFNTGRRMSVRSTSSTVERIF